MTSFDKRTLGSMNTNVVAAAIAALLVPASVLAADGAMLSDSEDVYMRAAQATSAEAVEDYWTEERMANAKPMPFPEVEASEGVAAMSATDGLPLDAYPMMLPGWNPDSDEPMPTFDDLIEIEPDDAYYDQIMGVTPMSWGSGPSYPTDYANYGPFQRWTWYGRYMTFPTSVIGKLFYRQNGNDYVCSGTVVGRNTVITAAHCLSDGNGNLDTELVFCPSFNKKYGVNPAIGCWVGTYMAMPGDYHVGANPDRDYGCFVTNPTGTVHGTSIGNVTGWAGVTANWPSSQMVMATGYPSAPPFQGSQIVFAAAPEWYSLDLGYGDGNVSKYIGNDMMQGSSGGSWLLGLRHPVDEYPDTDGSNITDPYAQAGPFVNGVNSTKRNGYLSEMSSPQFTSSASDPRDVLDVINACFANGGN